jgi:hypothetical protein
MNAATTKQINYLLTLQDNFSFRDAVTRQFWVYAVIPTNELTQQQASKLIDYLKHPDNAQFTEILSWGLDWGEAAQSFMDWLASQSVTATTHTAIVREYKAHLRETNEYGEIDIPESMSETEMTAYVSSFIGKAVDWYTRNGTLYVEKPASSFVKMAMSGYLAHES